MTDGLPEGWAAARLGDLGKWSSGGTPNRKKPEFFGGEIPWVLTGDLNDGIIHDVGGRLTPEGLASSSAKVFPKETLLVAMYGATIGKLGRLGSEASTNQACAALIPSEENAQLLPFIFLFLLSQRRELKKLGKGGAQPNISQTVIKELPIRLPPLAEQHRIVEKIETLFAQLDKGEEAVRQVQMLLKRYRQSVLKAAVTGELTADWRAAREGQLEHGRDLLSRILMAREENWQGRGRYKPPVEPVTTGLPDLPEGWVWASVDQVLRAGLSNGRSVPDAQSGFPVMRLTALRDGRVDTREMKIGAWSADDAEPYLVEIGDILVSRGNGSKQLVGKGGLVSTLPELVAYPDTMIRIPISLGFLDPEWFLYLWNSPFMRQKIEAAAKTTAGIYKINQNDIRAFTVPLPPLAEQEEIRAQIDDVMSKVVAAENLAATELTRSAALRQSILKDAFSGKLVPQDPADEPASALLDRIRQKRSA
ncbi:hypothetical protein GLS40_17725 [Pseudooceanicola sp. 216_PA32_1]|uniref:Type I restriction modification DNA specificity domain-containing protein n=1 Tax=Pseudooceanicola pacificus TaxID=2676438 RepID=A0A844WHC0_9RHOB|nr:restriction endonuclease subunit S [Pseudooceanicola pacificus]MWB79869.1 hypothetical protein [Pseudooceanicola pacificus]